MKTDYHCPGCRGDDYLGRPCRGRPLAPGVRQQVLEPYAMLAENGMVDRRTYMEDAVYHALVYRIYRGAPPMESVR